ncbi:MAG: FlgD immunoglobulin-like domain containing protein [bacterium]
MRWLYGLLVILLPCRTGIAQEEIYLHGDLSTPNGSDFCNPCVDDVIRAVNTLRDHGASLGFNWGANHPEVQGAGTSNHWQGIQRLLEHDFNIPYLVVSSSHHDLSLTVDGEVVQTSGPARLAIVAMASRNSNGSRLRSNRLEWGKRTRDVSPPPEDVIVVSHIITSDFDHPGGMQAIGKYLFVGSDGRIGHQRDSALFTLWDMSHPLAPREVWAQRWELPVENANSVGITRLQDGRYLMVRALSDAKQLEFYVLGNDLEVSPAQYFNGQVWDLWDHSELRTELLKEDGSPDLSWSDLGSIFGNAGYQSTNIVTECGTGRLYLIASHGRRPESHGGGDFVDAYHLDIPVLRPNPDRQEEGVIITKVAKRHMFPAGNAGARQGDLQAAAGVYVSPDHKLYFYATEHGATGKGGFVKMIEFGPQEPLSEVTFIEDAWVELYSLPDFQGRSIVLDFSDYLLRDYDDFGNIERFDDEASSVIYALPPGYRLRLFAEIQQGSGFFDLEGSGFVKRIAKLSDVMMSHGVDADDKFSSAEWIDDGAVTSSQQAESRLRLPFRLHQNYPNPFNAETVISYELKKAGLVRVEIYDIRGQQIKTLTFEHQTPGSYSVTWSGRDELGNDVASGTYLFRIEMGEFVDVKTLTIVR